MKGYNKKAGAKLAIALLSTSSMTLLVPSAARAQALTPVVDVCTGVSLNESALTNLLNAVNTPIVAPLQGTVNGLLGILLPPLNIDVTGIIDNAVAGNPLTIDVLATDGTIVGPGDCNVTVDGVTLNTPAGMAIGGNQISGLGSGAAASAGTIDSIAFGSGATTSGTATGAVALGTGASVTAVNSVALGTGSIASRGPLTGYTAPGLTGTFNSAGTVSVGGPGALRQITNLAPGTAASDAATVGQVTGAVATLADAAVQYDSATRATITLGGASGTVLDNVGPGALSATSEQAVNGGQLFATNTQVGTNTANIAANTADIADLGTDVAANTANIAANTASIADNTADIAANVAVVADLSADVAVNSADIAALQAGAVQYDEATRTSITLGGAGGTTIGNLAAGELSATSSEAVNGSQLFATNQQVAQNTADIADLQTDVTTLAGQVGALSASAVQYDDASQASITLGGAAGTTVANVAAGELSASSTDAVNGSQLFATNTQVAGNTADIASLDARTTVNEGDITALGARVTVNEGDIAALDARTTINEGDIASLDGRVTVNEGDIASLDARTTVNEGDIASLETAVTNVDARVTTNTSNIATLQAQVANTPVRFVSNADRTTPSASPTDTVALVAASGGAATLTNVAAGALSATSTDAVNGSQLFATNQQVAANTADIATIEANLAGITVVAVQYSNPGTPTVSNGGTITNDVTLVGANAAAPVALHNVANGTAANDAVNLGQLQSQITGAMASAQSYTDTRIAVAMDLMSTQMAEVQFDLNELREDAMSGVAGAMAFAGIPQTMEVGKSMLGGAVAYYRGQTAFAFGFSSSLGDGKAAVKVGGSMDTRGHVGVTAGGGIAF